MTKQDFLAAFKSTEDKLVKALSNVLDEDTIGEYRNAMRGWEKSIIEAEDDIYLYQLVLGIIHGMALKDILEK